MTIPRLFQVTVLRGPRELRVRQLFTSVEEARAYVREQCLQRQLELSYESLEPSEYTGALMLLAGSESFWIQPFVQHRICQLRTTPPPPPARSALPAFEEWLRYVFN